jgi:hypothetical protein
VNPRPVVFEGVERANVYGDLQRDLMREHVAVREGFRGVSQKFVPRSLPSTMGTTTYSAASWDFVIVAGSGTIYLPKLGPDDAGDEIKVALRSGGVDVVVDSDAVMNGSGSISPGPFLQRFTWDGAEWWVG